MPSALSSASLVFCSSPLSEHPLKTAQGTWFLKVISNLNLGKWPRGALHCLKVVQMVKNLPAMQETWVRSLRGEAPLEKGTATHSSILACRTPWKGEAWWATVHGVRQRIRNDSVTNTHTKGTIQNTEQPQPHSPPKHIFSQPPPRQIKAEGAHWNGNCILI